MDEIQKIKLILTIYYFKSSNIYPINFIKFRGTLHIFEKIKKNGKKQKKNKNDLNQN